MKSCCLVSGEILGERIALAMAEPASLEEFLQEFAARGKAYLSYTYEMLGEDEAVVRVERSAFWEVIKRTSIEKIKRAGCTSEVRFMEAVLRRFFDAEVERRRCYMLDSAPCEFVVRIRR